jgi:hypothetical protein
MTKIILYTQLEYLVKKDCCFDIGLFANIIQVLANF